MKCSFSGCNSVLLAKKYKGITPMCMECRRMSVMLQYIKKVDTKLTLLIYGIGGYTICYFIMSSFT